MEITQVEYKPPAVCDKWFTVHWSTPMSEAQIEKLLSDHNLHPEVIYRDKGGTLWIPVESEPK